MACSKSSFAVSVFQVKVIQVFLECLHRFSKHSFFSFQAISKLSSGKGNFVFSPLSLSKVLGMINVGASGETAVQIQKTLNIKSCDYEKSNTEMVSS